MANKNKQDISYIIYIVHSSSDSADRGRSIIRVMISHQGRQFKICSIQFPTNYWIEYYLYSLIPNGQFVTRMALHILVLLLFIYRLSI